MRAASLIKAIGKPTLTSTQAKKLDSLGFTFDSLSLLPSSVEEQKRFKLLWRSEEWGASRLERSWQRPFTSPAKVASPYSPAILIKKLISLVNQIMWPIIAPHVTNYSAAQGLGLGLGDQSEEFLIRTGGWLASPAAPLRPGWLLKTRARGTYFSKKHGFLGLTPVYSETTALSKPYYILKLQSMRKFLRKCLLFTKQKIDSTGYYDIEDRLSDLNWKLRRFMGGYGVRVVGCQELLIVRMP